MVALVSKSRLLNQHQDISALMICKTFIHHFEVTLLSFKFLLLNNLIPISQEVENTLTWYTAALA